MLSMVVHDGLKPSILGGRCGCIDQLPWCTTPIEAESSLGPDSHHPIISLSGIPSAVMVLRGIVKLS